MGAYHSPFLELFVHGSWSALTGQAPMKFAKNGRGIDIGENSSILSVMTTLLSLALFRKADDLWFDREIEVRATREKVEATVIDFGLPALTVVLEDIEYVGRTLGIAEIRAGKHLWERSMSEDRSPGSISYSDLGQVGRLGKKVVEMRMRIIRNSPETG